MDRKSYNREREKAEQIINSRYVTGPTREVLWERLNFNHRPRFFDQGQLDLLNAVCDCLMDQEGQNRNVELGLFIDHRLQHKASKGWRYDRQPPDEMAYPGGLKAINAEAQHLWEKDFVDLAGLEQIKLLENIQNGKVETNWEKIDPQLFFEDLLAEAAEIYYSHPLVQAQINYVGMADAEGWSDLRLDHSEKLEQP